jgi:DNA-binding CsgD family transcriptional regulator
MLSGLINIGIIEPSDLLFEGLTNILLKNQSGLRFYRIYELEDYYRFTPALTLDIVILNTSQVQNRIKLFRNIKKEQPTLRWLGIIQSLMNAETLSEFDETIKIDEPSEEICRKIVSLTALKNLDEISQHQKPLTERETEVLKLLSKGLSNKEISDSLNISIHTVISHRKNLIHKTGIKSQSGLTIYAISNNIISLDNT